MPTQLWMGHHVGVVVHEYQPVKIAAMEGIWNTQYGAPTILFAIPNQQAERNDYVLEIPKLATFLNTGDWNAQMKTSGPRKTGQTCLLFSDIPTDGDQAWPCCLWLSLLSIEVME